MSLHGILKALLMIDDLRASDSRYENQMLVESVGVFNSWPYHPAPTFCKTLAWGYTDAHV